MNSEHTSRPAILHELNLGQHTLFIMEDRSIDIIDLSGTSYLADNGMILDADETYRLFVSLRELYK